MSGSGSAPGKGKSCRDRSGGAGSGGSGRWFCEDNRSSGPFFLLLFRLVGLWFLLVVFVALVGFGLADG
ncbi:hypothetical protein RJT34_20433 [Clitoria ternatea]|uniref:Uncharacterized protein n=1 Tax=Clitoria ternatea TaxID=43366 RepID=A0AAN9IST3_CLITE